MKPLKASELVAVLQKRIEEFGDLEILVNTKHGAMYGLFSEDEVICTPTAYVDGSRSKALQIGTN